MGMSVEAAKRFSALNANSGEDIRLAMQELQLTGRVTPAGALLVVNHAFESAEDEPLEAVYAFGLPRDAALRRFTIEGCAFSAHSELKAVEEAQAIYEEGIEQGHLSSLARIYRDGVVNLNAGNIRPGERVLVRLEIVAGVEPRDNGFRFRFPFTLAPAYHARARTCEVMPGRGAIELPEDLFGDVILPEWSGDAAGLHRVGFSLDAWSPGGLEEVSSPSHPLRVRTLGEQGMQAALATAGDMPDRDLVLDAGVRKDAVTVLTGLDDSGKGRFAAVLPSTLFGQPSSEPRRMVFLLDRSGSMGGTCMKQARAAVRACLGALSQDDEFNIIAFDSEIETLRDTLLPGTQQNRDAAADFLDGVDARGGTELLAGMLSAGMQLQSGGGDIFILTDGQVFGGEDIIQQVHDNGIRIHCLGIGSASRDRFLTQLTRKTQGMCRFLTPRERVDTAALELFAALGKPVACDLQCEVTGFGDARIEPAPAEMAFKGMPVTVHGSCAGAGKGSLLVSWQADSARKSFETPFEVEKNTLGETLKLAQGARLISDLEAMLGESGPARARSRRKYDRLERRLEKLSEAYGLASRKASLVAVVERAGDREGDVPVTRVIPVGMPDDTDYNSYFPHMPKLHRSACCKMGPTSKTPKPGPGRAAGKMYAQRIISPEAGHALDERGWDKRFKREDTVDVLMDIAGRLEADGGLPGSSRSKRILDALLALLAFSSASAERGDRIFKPHIARLLEFLKNAAPDLQDETRASSLTKALEIVEQGGTLPGDWTCLLEKRVIYDSGKSAAIWKKIHSACRNA
jgi:Ca-activated chloride channel homolog